MGKKKHAEHVNHERWLVSYADLLTLLFAFFVVLFASSVSDKKKSQKMSQALQQAFDPGGPFEAHSKTPAIADNAGTSVAQTNPLDLAVTTADGHPQGWHKDSTGNDSGKAAEAKEKQLQATIIKAQQQHLVQVHQSEDGTTLSLDSAGFFDSGSAEIKPATIPLINKIAASLPQGALRIEGHTDNHPIHTEQFRSNWELSTARAAAIAQVILAASSVEPANFSIAGYGEFHPVASNDTEAGRAANRRVDIVLLKPKSAAPLAPAIAAANKQLAEVKPLPKPLAPPTAAEKAPAKPTPKPPANKALAALMEKLATPAKPSGDKPLTSAAPKN